MNKVKQLKKWAHKQGTDKKNTSSRACFYYWYIEELCKDGLSLEEIKAKVVEDKICMWGDTFYPADGLTGRNRKARTLWQVRRVLQFITQLETRRKPTMKKVIVTVAFILALICTHLAQTADDNRFSIQAWRHWSGYTGEICVIATDDHNQPYCVNGDTYDGASINAYEGYQLWVECYQDKSKYACEDLSN